MSEDFDKRFKDHVSQVFENFADEQADKGWLLLREKYPEKNNKHLLAWWWLYTAAALLIVSGLGVWVLNNKPQPSTANTAYHTQSSTVNSSRNNTANLPLAPTNNATKNDTKTGVNGNNKTTILIASSTQNIRAHTTRVGHHQHVAATVARPAEFFNPSSTNQSANDENAIKTDVKPLIDTVQTLTNHNKTATDTLSKTNNPANPATEKQSIAAHISNKKIFWSIFASAYYNYAKSSSTQFNTGGGTGLTVKLSNRVNISTGLGIYQSSLLYQNQPITNPANNLLASTSYTGTSYYVYTNYSNSANLLMLDIPVNVSYRVSKGGNYVSVGASSATYITENYREKYNYYNPYSASAVLLSQDITTQKHFDTFDIAKTLNLSAGFGYPFGKNRLIIEPFLKYPLGNLGYEHLKYGSAGINLRFSFGQNAQ